MFSISKCWAFFVDGESDLMLTQCTEPNYPNPNALNPQATTPAQPTAEDANSCGGDQGYGTGPNTRSNSAERVSDGTGPSEYVMSPDPPANILSGEVNNRGDVSSETPNHVSNQQCGPTALLEVPTAVENSGCLRVDVPPIVGEHNAGGNS